MIFHKFESIDYLVHIYKSLFHYRLIFKKILTLLFPIQLERNLLTNIQYPSKMKELNEYLSKVPNSSFASVMGTGILSDAFFHLGMMSISNFVMILSAFIYTVLICLFIFKLFICNKNIFKYSSKSVLQAFTFIAGTSVLFTRLYESHISIYTFFMAFVLLVIIVLFFSLYLASNNFQDLSGEYYLLFLPIISLLSVSIFIAFTKNQIPSILFGLDIPFLIIAQTGAVLVIVYSLIHLRRRTWNITKLNGYYMIYSGILSLTGYSILGTEAYYIPYNTYSHIFHYVAIADIVASIFIAFIMLSLFAIKIKKGLFDKNYKVSAWGTLFPLGVDAIGYYTIANLYHVQFFLYLSYIFTSLGLLVLIGITIEFVLYIYQIIKEISLKNPDRIKG